MTNRRLKAKSSFGFGVFPEAEQQCGEETGKLQDGSISASSAGCRPMPSGNLINPAECESFADDSGNDSSIVDGCIPSCFPRNFSPPDSDSPDFGSRNFAQEPQTQEFRKKSNSNKPGQRSGVTFSRFGPIGKKGEPLCLAELLALERKQGLVEPDYDETYEKFRQNGEATYLSELEKMSLQELIVEARKESVEKADETSTRQELVVQILKKRVRSNGLMFGEGTLEILPDHFGFLRSSEYHYASSPDDIYISPSQIRRFGLRPGCMVSGQIRPPKENERYFALLRIEAINREEPGMLVHRPQFDNLTPIYPDSQIFLALDGDDFDLKLLDSLIPFGYGQRALIVSPPKSGKTVMLQKMAKAVLNACPEAFVFVLLVDEQPEEATEMIRRFKGNRCEVVCSLFDESPTRHVHIAEIVLEKAKRMVECGKDVFIFLDSLTRLARAWNSDLSADLPSPSGNPEPPNLQMLKKCFGSARKAEEGGSLTIVATLLTQTGNPFDQAVCDTFKGTGNWEVYLDRELAEKRIWPAIDIHQSGVRHEDSLLSDEQLQRSSALRRQLSGLSSSEAVSFLAEHL